MLEPFTTDTEQFVTPFEKRVNYENNVIRKVCFIFTSQLFRLLHSLNPLRLGRVSRSGQLKSNVCDYSHVQSFPPLGASFVLTCLVITGG